MEKQDSKKEKSGSAQQRKGKVTTALRTAHSEQLVKLQVKHQQDVDFLEDIRNFTKMRAIIEKDYAQSLLKLATSYLQRKCPTVPEMKSDGNDYKTVYSVWRTLLDETEKIAKARLAATEVYQQQVSENAKVLRMNKLQVSKKCFDNLRKMHEEIQQCVVEIDKSKKLYFEEEHMAHDARQKADDADEKLKRKKGRIFQSISSLQKNSAKFSFRKEACDIQATKARNDYVLALVAANAHQSKYYDTDLPELIHLMDCDIYDKVKEYILLVSRTELLTCAACQSAFSIVQEQATMATKQYTMECFFHDNPVLSDPLLYEFEPCDNDKINKLSIEHNAGLCLSKEARRWATCVAKETRVIRDCTVELKKLVKQLDEKPTGISAEQTIATVVDLETRIDELRQIIRRARTSKKKAEARLDAMREAGVNVDEWMRTSDSESVTTASEGEPLSRSGTLNSRASPKGQPEYNERESEADDAFYDSDNATEPPSSAPVDGGSDAAFSAELASAADVVAAVQSAWDAAAEEEEEEEYLEPEQAVAEVEFPPPPPPAAAETKLVNGEVAPTTYTRCIALFSYQASNTDEISFVEQEELELISEGDGDGWVKARNCKGEEGYIPQNYVEVLEAQVVETTPCPKLTSFSSVDYTMPNEDEGIQLPNGELPPPPPDVDYDEKPSDLPLPPVLQDQVKDSEGFLYCRALYDYEATCDEELTFFETQVIKILRKCVCDVDDGWWEGELDGTIGLFPSLVVEELKESGEPLTPVDIISPTVSAPPPAFTPPNPQLLVLPDQVILTQPTPEIEHPAGHPPQEVAEPDLQMDLPEEQQTKYHQQFPASDSESSEHEVVAVAEEATKYAPLESSPESPTKAVATAAKETPLEQIAEEKTESPPPEDETECASVVTVVITEAEPQPESPNSEDEFIYREKSATTEEKESKEEDEIKSEVKKEKEDEVEESKEEKETEAEKEIEDKENDATYQNSVDAFECSFPDDDSSFVVVEPCKTDEAIAVTETAAEKAKVECDVDIKMDVNNDVTESAKAGNSGFEDSFMETTG